VRRYDSKFVIGTRTNEYSVSLSKHKEFHELLAKYYPPDWFFCGAFSLFQGGWTDFSEGCVRY